MRLADILWLGAIADAKRGKFETLARLLRSGWPISQDVRERIAAALEFKRRRGSPTRSALDTAYQRMRQPVTMAANYVMAFKRENRAAGRVRGVEKEGIAIAAERFGVSEESIHNRLHRSRKIKRT